VILFVAHRINLDAVDILLNNANSVIYVTGMLGRGLIHMSYFQMSLCHNTSIFELSM
jgi:hypothetical protein